MEYSSDSDFDDGTAPKTPVVEISDEESHSIDVSIHLYLGR